ncbi:MAG: hypothetical protein ACE5NW_05610 [Acidiferrobacterales bacterium]
MLLGDEVWIDVESCDPYHCCTIHSAKGIHLLLSEIINALKVSGGMRPAQNCPMTVATLSGGGQTGKSQIRRNSSIKSVRFSELSPQGSNESTNHARLGVSHRVTGFS